MDRTFRREVGLWWRGPEVPEGFWQAIPSLLAAPIPRVFSNWILILPLSGAVPRAGIPGEDAPGAG